jgi:hypothetical protein
VPRSRVASRPLIRNRDDGVDAFLEIREASFRLPLPFLAFERKWLRDDGYSQRVEFCSQARNDRRCTGTGTATEARRDEHHVGAFESFNDLVGVFERCLPSDIRIRARAESFGQLGTDLDFHGRFGLPEGLCVGIRNKELDAAEARRNHAVDGIGTAAAYADDLDVGSGSHSFLKQKPDVCIRHVFRYRCSFFCHGSLAAFK